MRIAAFILAALLSVGAFASDALAQPAAAPGAGDLAIIWQVRNRFRLFRAEADFLRQVVAQRSGSVLAAEQKLARDTDGRGWARDMLDRLCINAAGRITESCTRDGERESYLAPKQHPIIVQLTGTLPPAAVCTWSFDDGTPPVRQATAPCSEEMKLPVAYGRPTIAAVGITRADGSVDSISTEIRVQDLLIAGLGDSIAAGEGNPDRPVALGDVGFCFRRFLGTGLSEYFRPSRAGYQGDKACPETPATPSAAAEWAKLGARWMSAACHRSLYGYQLRTALALAVENPQIAVTFLPLACSGASIEAGLLGSQRARECPLTGSCGSSVPGQIGQLQELLAHARREAPDRRLDAMLLTIGANDIRFSGLVADVIMSAGVERTLFSQGGLVTSVSEAQGLLDRGFPADFVKLRAALKPLVGGDLSRVVYVTYGSPARQGAEACPAGRDGFDVHPAFTVDGARIRSVTDFEASRFLPRIRQLARCEAGSNCRDSSTEQMSFVDMHQRAFLEHGYCVRSPDDPPFDRECFSPLGESFDADPVTAATAPLRCGQRPNAFRPYASRARWIRTPNDSYFTAMSFPQALPVVMQPSNIHDATWGTLSAVYGGAIHPTAEGHAAMADAALPVLRDVLSLKAPPAVTAEPLAPLR